MWDGLIDMAGTPVTMMDGKLNIPNDPIIHYIEGDGIGIDITPVMMKVVDAAVSKSYDGEKNIVWSEVLAGEKAFHATGEWLPQATLDAMRDGLVSIKGPLTTPVGGGIRSLNVALRQKLDLYACVRPVRWYDGTPSPVKSPGDVDMIIFRENSEDVYAGIEWEAGSDGVKKLIDFLQNEMGVDKIRFPNTSGIGIKPISQEGTARIVRAAFQYAIDNDKESVTLVHKGNIMKFTEGGFRDWGYSLAKDEFGAVELDGGPWCTFENPNTGKTSVFNALTGLNQKVGNYPGITVDKKQGICKLSRGVKAHILDLPGTYSLNASSLDENVVIELLLNKNDKDYPDVAIIVSDVENLKRNLLLFTQIKDLKIPTILVINMSDLMTRKGITLDIELLEEKSILSLNINLL